LIFGLINYFLSCFTVFILFKVVGDDFLKDPCLEPHNCTPVEGAKDKVDRLTYKKFQEIRRDPQYAECHSRQVWEDMLEACDDKTMGDPEERKEMKLIFCSTGFEKKRRTIARLASKPVQTFFVCNNVC
ncbi:hypothetical protein OESDEN_07452, partial [Oesophagostomum dentatum]